MLRRCGRSMGSNRRIWEESVKYFTSSCSGNDFVPSRDFHSPGGHRALSGLKPCSAQSNKRIYEEVGVDQDVAASKLRFPFLDQRLKSSVSSAAMLDNQNLSRRGSLLFNKNIESWTYPCRRMGDPLPSTRDLCPPTGYVRLSTSKLGDAHDSETPDGSDTVSDKDIEDFQHEEIVGPTVERDFSDTADQVRESLNRLRETMASFGTGFVILGTVQLVAAIWGSWIKTDPSSIGLWRDLAFVLMSYTFAYLLRNARSANDFFSKLEGRSRIRVLVLSLQVFKSLSHFFQRSAVMVKFVAFTSVIALIKEALP